MERFILDNKNYSFFTKHVRSRWLDISLGFVIAVAVAVFYSVFMDYHKHFCVFIDHHEHHDCGNRLSDQCIPHECLCRSFYNARVVSKAIHVFEKGFLGSPLGKHCELPQGNRRREAISKSREIIHVLPPLPPPPLFPKWIKTISIRE